MKSKVVVQHKDMHGSLPTGSREKVATADMHGNAGRWMGNFRVQRQNPQGMISELAAEGACRVFAVKLSKEELAEMRRDAKRPAVLNADGLYCEAQICVQGHVQSSEGSFAGGERCTKCGAACIDQCQYCRAPIRGRLANSPLLHYDLPFYCHAPECGLAYPWMLDKLETARELLCDIESLSLDERDELWDLITFVMSDPQSGWAQAKTKLIRIKLAKVSKESREALLDFTAKVAAEVMNLKS